MRREPAKGPRATQSCLYSSCARRRRRSEHSSGRATDPGSLDSYAARNRGRGRTRSRTLPRAANSSGQADRCALQLPAGIPGHDSHFEKMVVRTHQNLLSLRDPTGATSTTTGLQSNRRAGFEIHLPHSYRLRPNPNSPSGLTFSGTRQRREDVRSVLSMCRAMHPSESPVEGFYEAAAGAYFSAARHLFHT